MNNQTYMLSRSWWAAGFPNRICEVKRNTTHLPSPAILCNCSLWQKYQLYEYDRIRSSLSHGSVCCCCFKLKSQPEVYSFPFSLFLRVDRLGIFLKRDLGKSNAFSHINFVYLLSWCNAQNPQNTPEYSQPETAVMRTGEAGGAVIHVAAPSTMIWHIQPPADSGDHQRHVTLLGLTPDGN